MPFYVIEFGKFARHEGGDAKGKGGTLVTRKRGDLIELSLEQAAEKHDSVRLATADEIAAGRALSMQMNPLPLPQPVKQDVAEPEVAEPVEEPVAEPAQPEPAPVVEHVAAPPPPSTLSIHPLAPAAQKVDGNEQTPKPRAAAKKKKKTAGSKRK